MIRTHGPHELFNAPPTPSYGRLRRFLPKFMVGRGLGIGPFVLIVFPRPRDLSNENVQVCSSEVRVTDFFVAWLIYILTYGPSSSSQLLLHLTT